MATEAPLNVTDEDLRRLDEALAQGVRSVTHSDGRQIQYPSIEAMQRARQFVAEKLGYCASKKGSVRRLRSRSGW